VVDQVAHEAAVEHGCSRADLAVVVRDSDDLAACGAFRNDGALDLVVADLVQKLGVADCPRADAAAGVELLEDSEQHHGDDEPHGNFGKPLIVQTKLQAKARDR